MNRTKTEWSAVARVYDPLAAGSIDGTDQDPHDRAIIRALGAKYKPNQGVQGDPLSTIFVAHLNHITTEETLNTVFAKYGQIKRLRLIRDVVTGFSKGYAFIEYEEERQAVRAQRDGNGQELDDKQLFVDFENERTMPGWIPRRLGGGFGGKRESGQLRFGGRARPFKKPFLAAGTFAGEIKTINHNQRDAESDRSTRGYSDWKREDSARDSKYRSSSSFKRDKSRSPSRNRDQHRRRQRSRSRSRDDSSRRRSHRSRSRSRSRNTHNRRDRDSDKGVDH